MKILFDLTALYDNFSGIERFASNIAKQFIILHPENEYVLVFKNDVNSFYLDLAGNDKIDFVVLNGKNKLLFNQVTLFNYLKKQKNIDCFYFLAFPEPILFKHKSIVTAIHDLGCWDVGNTMTLHSKLYFKMSYRKTMRCAKTIITVSEFSKNRIINIGKVESDKIKVVYNGIDKNFVKNTSMRARDKVCQKYNLPKNYILTLSTIEPRKNIKLLLMAYEKLLYENINVPLLVLAGRKGWKMENLLAGFSEKLRDSIIFTGFIDDRDISVVYSNADFFVFPSRYEGFGIPPLEAMACGVPVISSNATSLPEVLGNAAVYFRSNDVLDLVDKMKDMLNIKTEDRKLLVSKGYEQAIKYSWREEASKL